MDWVAFKWAVVLLLVLFSLDLLVARKARGSRRDQTERWGASLALIYILLFLVAIGWVVSTAVRLAAR